MNYLQRSHRSYLCDEGDGDWKSLSTSQHFSRAVAVLRSAFGGAAAFAYLGELASNGVPLMDPMARMMGSAPDVVPQAPTSEEVQISNLR